MNWIRIFYSNTKEKTELKLRFVLLNTCTSKNVNERLFFLKKILGGKHQSKKFRLQICNLVNINKKVWSLLIGKNMHGNNPMYEKYLTGLLFTHSSALISGGMMCERKYFALMKKCFYQKYYSCTIPLLDSAIHFMLVREYFTYAKKLIQSVNGSCTKFLVRVIWNTHNDQNKA